MYQKLTTFALSVVMAAAIAGQLPYFVKEVRIAQLRLLKESQTSHWGTPMLLPIKIQRQ
jgi:hypothetical protein